MSNVIRNLVVKVGLDLGDFQKKLTKIGTDLKTVGKNLQSTGSAMTKGITLPSIAAVSALTALTVKTAQSSDELQTLSKQTGWSTTSLQEMKYASDQVGYSFDNLKPALSKLTMAVGKAQKANQDYISITDEVSVSLFDQNGALKSNQQLFYETLDALGSVKDETKRDVATQAIFSKSFMELNPLIAEGSAGLKKLAQEAHNAGAVMSETDVNTMADLNDTLDSMRATLGAAVAQIGVAFAPALKSLQPIITDTIVPAIKGFADLLKGLFDWFNKLSPQAQKFVLFLGATAVAAGPVVTVIGKLTSGVGNALKAISSMSKATSVLGFLKSFTSSTGLAVAGITLLVGIIGGLIIAFTGAETPTEKLRKKMEALNNEIKDINVQYDEQTSEIKASAGAADKLASQLYTLSNKEHKTNEEKQRMVSLVNQLNEMYPDLNLQINKQTGLLNKQYDTVKELIAAKKQEILYNAYADQYTEVLKKQIEQEEAYKQAQEETAAAQAKLNQAQANAKSAGTGIRTEFDPFAARAQIDLNAAQNNTQKMYEDLQATGKTLDDLSAKMEGAAAGMYDTSKAAKYVAGMPSNVSVPSPSVLAGVSTNISVPQTPAIETPEIYAPAVQTQGDLNTLPDKIAGAMVSAIKSATFNGTFKQAISVLMDSEEIASALITQKNALGMG